MKNKYNENVIKELHYNSGVSTLIRSTFPAFTAVCIFCGKDAFEYAKVKAVSDNWVKVSEAAIQAGQPVPENTVKVVVHTTQTTINNTGFETK